MNFSMLENGGGKVELTKEMFTWLNLHASLLGSRAFKVATEDSDYDFFLTEDLYECFCSEFPNDFQKLGATKYLQVLPIGSTSLVRGAYEEIKVDIVIYPTEEDEAVVLDCVEFMQLFIPREILLDKKLRVDIFMQLLVNRGFKDAR